VKFAFIAAEKAKATYPVTVLCRMHGGIARGGSVLTPTHNRSKFNVALGVEAQGFCVLP